MYSNIAISCFDGLSLAYNPTMPQMVIEILIIKRPFLTNSKPWIATRLRSSPLILPHTPIQVRLKYFAHCKSKQNMFISNKKYLLLVCTKKRLAFGVSQWIKNNTNLTDHFELYQFYALFHFEMAYRIKNALRIPFLKNELNNIL